MTRISLRAFAVIASAILIGSVSVVPVWAASYRVFEYFHFEGLPDDHCQMEPTWGPEKTAWQECNYHASNPIGEAKITRSARNIDVNGVTYACVGWEFATGSITPASGKVNFVSFNLDADSSITWIYKKAHKVSFSVSQMSNRLSAWGDDPAGPNTSTPTDILPLRWDSIAAGSNHTLAISQDGSLWAWGNNQDGQLGLGDNTKRARPTRVAADLNGDGDPDRDWVSVAATGDYSLAIKSNGTLWAWGRNQYYQLGLGYWSLNENSPKRVGTDTDWTSVAAGLRHSLAIKSNGKLYAWGYNYYGQLGLGAGGDGDRNTPTQVDADLDIDGLPDSDWVSVAAAGYYSMARKSSYGATYAWGYNGVGSSRNFPSIKSYHCVSIAAGGTWTNSHALVVLDGTRDRGRVDGMIAWGKNEYGQLGLGHTTNIYGGEWVGPDTDWVSVAAGGTHSLAIKSDGTLWAWGRNNDGQLGLGHTSNKNTPTQVISGPPASWVSVAAGYRHALALNLDGTLWAWGDNGIGQLGLGGGIVVKYTPTQVGTESDWTSVEAGYHHSLAIKSDGTLWAWGWNTISQLGLGADQPNKYTPVKVGSDTDWTSVAAGYDHSLAIKSNGTLWAWGDNGHGQLGLGHDSDKSTPTQVVAGPLATWVSVAVGAVHTLALRADGTLWAWGYNYYGQLGLGGSGSRNTPTQVMAGSLATWASVAAGTLHTLAVRADGTLWAWGKHEDGQLGQCTPEIIYETEEVCTWVDGHEICETILIPKEVCGEVRTPSQVGTDTDWVSVAAGEKHTVAIRGPARFDFKPYIGNGLLAEGTQVEASAKVIPTDGSRPYYLTNFTANPTTGGSSFTVESDLNFTWTYEPALELTVAFDQNVPDGVRANAGSNPPEGKNQFVEGSEVTLQILPVVKDPDTGTTYVCTGWTGTDRVPSSGTGSSVTVESLTVNSSITWKYAEARSLTTEFDGLPDHLQTDVFDPRGADKGWDPEEPVWLAKESNQTINPPTEIYDEGGRVRYVLDLGGSFGDKDLPDPFVVTRDYTVTWKYRKEVRLRIGFGMGGSYDATDIITETGLKVDGDSPHGDAILPEGYIDYYFEAFDLETHEPGEVLLPVTMEVNNTVQLGGEQKNCTGLVVLTGNSPLTEVDATINPVLTSFQLTKPTEVVWNYVDAQQQVAGSPVSLPGGVDPSREPAEIQLLSHAATSTVENSFYWDEAEDKLYATRTLGSALLKWYKNDGSNQTIDQYVYAVWPTAGMQSQIVGAPVNLQPPESAFTFEEIHYSEAYGEGMPGSTQENPVFNPPNSGKSLLRFSRNSDGELSFVVVNSVRWDDETVDDLTVDIGKDIRSPKDGNGQDIHQDPEGKNGYVLFEKAYYDGLGDDRAYDRSTREGQIIPVNETTADTPVDRRMVVVWYETGAAAGVGWPVKPVRYLCRWPQNPEKIIIASGDGSEPLANEYEYTGQVYNQPDSDAPGYNPNEEHALLLGDKVYALRNDLNTYQVGSTWVGPLAGEEKSTSQPYVLLKYWYPDTESWAMKIFKVEATDANHDFTYSITAAKPIIPLMPMDALPKPPESMVSGVTTWYHRDHKGGHWAKAANWGEDDDPEPAEDDKSRIVMHWYYPLQSGFYYPPGFLKENGEPVGFGDPVPFLNGGNSHQDLPVDVAYVVSWPDDVKTLNIGETLTKAKKGLPDIVNWAAGQVIFDENVQNDGRPLARLFDPYTERSVLLSTLPDGLRTESVEGKLRFPDLPFSLRSRLFYDPNTLEDEPKKLIFKGISHDPGIGEPLLLPNIMTVREKERLIDFEPYWRNAIEALFTETHDRLIDQKQKLVGVPMALTAGAAGGQGYLVLAENNDESLEAAPVALHVIKVTDGPYRGEIKVIKPDDVFDEKLTLRHSGDFGGEPERLWFAWYYKPDNSGLPPAFPEDTTDTNGWVLFDEGQGMNDITIEGAGKLTLSDNWFMVHYYYGNHDDPTNPSGAVYPPLAPDPDPLLTEYWSQWAGAPGGETAQLAEGWIKRVVSDLNPLDARVKDFRNFAVNTDVSMVSQLGQRYEGDIALSGAPENLNNLGLIEAYETVIDRARDFSIDAAPPTDYGPVNNAILNGATRIADFYTLLGNEAYADAQDPTIGFDTRGGELGAMAASIFAFQNQFSSLLEEELTLLRGRDDSMATTRAPPVYNRLVWNFTQADGELAYVQTYNISDKDESGVVDELDAKIFYPQGRGDAWGHYLTAMKVWYKLLNHSHFTWEPRVESVLVGGAPIPVDYLDERKFAETATAKARAGAEIVNLTYRQSYVDDPADQWQGYKDTDTERAWGFDGWARRAGQGAYFDWAVANAMLPSQDPVQEHTGIQKIDRTTVPELAGIASEFRAIQTQADQADRGLNPLGLAKGVVPFDINPDLLEVGSGIQAETHFSQVYQRAIGALENAQTVFDYATQYTMMLRGNEDALVDFKREIDDQEREYTNRLIEIFGYPYEGDIGPGGTYKSGYNGPDLIHYLYVDLPDLTGEPLMSQQLAYTYTFEFNDEWDKDADPLLKGLNVTTTTNDQGQITPSVEITYHIDSEAPWFPKPDGWGKRRAPGEIQMALSDLIQAHASYKQGLTELEGLLGGIQAAVDILEAKHGVFAHQIQVQRSAADKITVYGSLSVTLQAIEKLLTRIATEVERWVEVAKEIVSTVEFGVTGGIPPFAGALTDTSVGVKASIIFGTNLLRGALETVADTVSVAALEMDLAIEQTAMDRDITLFVDDARFEVQQMVKELETMEGDVRAKLQELYTLKEAIHQAAGQVQAVLVEGERLLTEREVFRKRAAGDVQDYRYQDMGFRVFRNDAVAKYRATFELAARYAYLAATAYDYETNLVGSAAGSGRTFLTDIVRQRSPGPVIDGVPVVGKRGLADPMARLSQNFEVHRGQLGFNNPQIETNRFSLRREFFRFKEDSDTSNTAWRAELRFHRVPDLLTFPPFKRFCRPFADESMAPQPGIAIPFSTEVNFGYNFFGWPLGAGDSAYDPSSFATKIRAVGVWFDGYDGAGLSSTPRVYLVPVGADVLRTPDADDFTTRRFYVVDQKLPVPFPVSETEVADETWIPVIESLSDVLGGIRRFSSFRAFPDSPEMDESAIIDSQSTEDTRLIGRSVWNTQWLLIIPGGTLLHDPDAGLETFINNVTDIKLFFQTYAYSGN